MAIHSVLGGLFVLFRPQNGSTKSSDKYERIIHAAVQVFAEKGFHHAKVSDVAKVAQVADGTIYLYFKNKDDLLVSIFEHSMDFFLNQAKEKLKSLNTAQEKLEGFIALHLKSVQKNQDLAQVLQIELRSSSKFMKGYKVDKFFEYLRCLEEIILDGQKSGAFQKDLNPDMATRALFGAIDEIALEWILMKKKRYSIEEAARDLSQMFFTGIQQS